MGVLNLAKKAFKDEFNGRVIYSGGDRGEGFSKLPHSGIGPDSGSSLPFAEDNTGPIRSEDSRPHPPGARATKKKQNPKARRGVDVHDPEGADSFLRQNPKQLASILSLAFHM
ncbi:hypothetical protein Tco_0407697 [Tanacetum coccineum]